MKKKKILFLFLVSVLIPLKKKQKKLLPQIYNLKRKKISLVFFYVCWDVTTKENMFFHLQFLVMRVFFSSLLHLNYTKRCHPGGFWSVSLICVPELLANILGQKRIIPKNKKKSLNCFKICSYRRVFILEKLYFSQKY